MMNDDLREAINKIRNECKSADSCVWCPLELFCGEHFCDPPKEWDEPKEQNEYEPEEDET